MGPPEPPELVERAMRALGIDPDDRGADRELGIQLGLNPGDASQARLTVARWRRGGGGHRPNYEATLKLLTAAGCMVLEGEPGRPQLADVVPLNPAARGSEQSVDRLVADQLLLQTALLADIAGAVASLQAAVASLHETLEKLERLPEEIREAAAPPTDNRRPA